MQKLIDCKVLWNVGLKSKIQHLCNVQVNLNGSFIFVKTNFLI